MAIVSVQAEVSLTKVTAVPIGNATDEFAGIVQVRAVVSAEGWQILFPASVRTRVQAVLCEFCRIPSVPTFTPSTAILPADTREIVVSVACPSSIFPVVVELLVQFDNVPAIVVLPFLRTVTASLLAPAVVQLPTTRSLSVETYVVAFPAPVVGYNQSVVSQNACDVHSLHIAVLLSQDAIFALHIAVEFTPDAIEVYHIAILATHCAFDSRHIAIEYKLLDSTRVHIAIDCDPLATSVEKNLFVCKSIAFAPLLFPPVARLSATARVNAQVPFGTIATSTLAAALVAVIDTTGIVALGAEVFTPSVKLVSQAPPVLAIVTIPSALVPVVVRVIQLHSTSLTLPPVADKVTV